MKKIDLVRFLPKTVQSYKGKEFELIVEDKDKNIRLSYETTDPDKNGVSKTREYSTTIPHYISLDKETFEVLGLLEAEMGKTHNGLLVFSNSELQLMRKTIAWFEKEWNISRNNWRWNIVLNIKEPEDNELKDTLKEELIEWWCVEGGVNFDKRYPKTLLFRNKTNNTITKNDGNLRIEIKNNLLSQVFKHILRKIVENLYYMDKTYIKGFLRGMIAGEGCIEVNKKEKKYNVHISASKEEERLRLQNLLFRLGIKSKIYKNYSELIISRRENLMKVLVQELISLHPEKHNKFLSMMKEYKDDGSKPGYFLGKKITWNSISDEKKEEIVDIYKRGIKNIKDIADKAKISETTALRVLNRNNLRKSIKKTPENVRKQIAQFAKKQSKKKYEEIAKIFNVHRSVVLRACKKYSIEREKDWRCRTQDWKVQKIINIYKEKPTVKQAEVMKEVGVSNSVVRRVRREHNLQHLGFMHLIGNNNPKYKSKAYKEQF